MGKRKERRLAAKMGAGRRVKLDLFAEPSGDVGGSPAKDDDGKDEDNKLDQELPNSPSSSGQPRENPLSLLGQYSDDELDDASKEEATNSNDNKQAKSSDGEPFEEGEIIDDEDHSSQKAHTPDVERDTASGNASLIADADAGASGIVSLDETEHDVNMENKDHVPVTSNSKTTEEMSSTWKMVLHEESNQYYYWNTVTGETSWDLPDSLTQETALTNKLETSGTEIKETAAGDVNVPATIGVNLDGFSASHDVGYTSETSNMKAIYELGVHVNQSLEQNGHAGSQSLGGFSVVGAVPYEASSLGNYFFSHSAGGENLTSIGYEGHDQSASAREQGTVELPSHLVKTCETLLERLKLLQGSAVDSNESGWLSRFMLEIEIRLSDIRCLLPYGLSLVPFWMHSERQLNQLENAINAEIGKQKSEVSGLQSSSKGKGANMEVGGEAKVDANTRKLSSDCSDATKLDVDPPRMVQEAEDDEVSDGGISNALQSSLPNPTLQLQSANKNGQEFAEGAVYGKGCPNPESESSEDVDMEIDMEVEEQSPSMKTIVDSGGQLVIPPGKLVQPSALIPAALPVSESELIIPPPPQEDWIPPPPPDEGIPDIPPPPPDEPPESLCPPPPPSEPVPSIYSEPQNIAYTSVDYYGNIISSSLGTNYQHPDAVQLIGITPSTYYAAISSAQPTSVLNPADSTAYYCIQNGALPVVPVSSSMEASNFLAVSSHPSYDPLAPVARTDIAPSQVSSTLEASAPATASTKEVASVSYSAAPTSVTAASTSVAVSEASTTVAKVQSKASRTKRPKVAVASSLRSNKKVSGLVDKWKAAKEELEEEEEEERVTPLEILENKKRREIEEWRAQQIASGEAKENANFQPLGGDWRERVKRKRAQKEVAAGTTSEVADNKMKQPDLSELSRDLPRGWQAYWDDSSKQVYYANSFTAETTWTKPTK
ncbi:unnamed protein product [Amaranthus hypochondriacus]